MGRASLCRVDDNIWMDQNWQEGIRKSAPKLDSRALVSRAPPGGGELQRLPPRVVSRDACSRFFISSGGIPRVPEAPDRAPFLWAFRKQRIVSGPPWGFQEAQSGKRIRLPTTLYTSLPQCSLFQLQRRTLCCSVWLALYACVRFVIEGEWVCNANSLLGQPGKGGEIWNSAPFSTWKRDQQVDGEEETCLWRK